MISIYIGKFAFFALNLHIVFFNVAFAQSSTRTTPTFTVDPPSSVLFSNKFGAVIPCVIDAYSANLKVTWIALVGDTYIEASDVLGLRLIREDGTLCFPPFIDSQYNANIHNTAYKCVGQTPYGTIGSQEVRVRAVIDKQIDVRSLDSTAVEGNDVLLRCAFPDDVYTVSSWISDDGLIVLPLTSANNALGKSAHSKHHILSTGELLISNVEGKDVRRRYRCQVVNRLTGERIDSLTWTRIILTDKSSAMTSGPRSNLNPTSRNIVVANEGESVSIYCSFDGHPRPNIEWYHIESSSTAHMRLLLSNDIYKVLTNQLFIQSVSTRDSGRIVCLANNSIAQARYETELFVKSSLRATLSSSSASPSPGEDVILNCNLTMIGSSFHEISSRFIINVDWYRDMKLIAMDHRVRKISETVINIRSFRYSDSGIIQCFVRLNNGDHNEWLQSAILVRMEEKAPSFTTVFSEQIKMLNTDLSLKCSVLGLPPPFVVWKVDEVEISNTHRVRIHSFTKTDGMGTVSYLNISSIRMQETGVFECQASNSIGSVSHKARINIMGSLYIKPIGNITSIVGHSVTLNCSFAGYPIDEVFFLKGNRRLPFEDRHSVPSIGKITINHIEKSDADVYKCVVLSLSGERSEETFELRVSAAPVISPFMFSENLEEGMRSSAVCSVISGDPPINIRWLKDGKPLAEIDPHVQVVSINEFISSLIIANITRYHKGNYTCVASSNVATTNFTATMTVRAAPIWIIKPYDRYSISGTSVRFECQTSGYPQPIIRWKYIKTNSALQTVGSEAVSILSSPQIHVLENGSLSLRSVEEKFEGLYICDASNGVGRSLETSAKLFVHSVPQLRVQQKQIIIRKLAQTQFSCTAMGSQPLTLQWLKNGNLLNNIDRYIVREEIKLEEKVSIIIINHAIRNDTAIFTCLAINLFGSESQDINVIIQEPPDPPNNLHPLEIGSRSATLTWNLAYFGNSIIIKHNVEYKKKSESWFDALMTTSTSNSITITNLLPMTTYELRVKLENEIGNSDYGNTITITTNMEAPSVIPQEVLCVPLDSKSIKISWSIVGPKSEIIDGFYIGYKPLNSMLAFTYKTMQTISNSITNTRNGQTTSKYEYNVDSLTRRTKYIFIVQAFNSKGAGPSSLETTTETFSNDPPEAPLVKVEGLSTSEATLIWEMPLRDDTNQVDGFIISYRSEGEQTSQWETVQLTRLHKSYVLRDLKCGTSYIVKIEAFNEVGNGKASDELRFTTAGKVPSAPDKSVFFTTNITFVILHLDKWDDGGCPISHFVIQYKPRLQADWVLLSNHISPEQMTVIIKELTAGTWHDLLITSKNDAGITETEYRFATLTLTGSTVEPLSIYDRSKSSLFEDPMILIPAMCAVVVLIVVSSATAFILLWKSREDEANAETYCRHRDNSRSDDLSLNSYSKVPKGDSLYDQQQRVQIYYPSGYATARATQQQQMQQHHQDNDINSECGASIEPRRMRRPFENMDHIYDVPHRMRNKEMGLNDTKVANYSLLWSKASSKELLDCVKEEPNSLMDSTQPGLTSSISSSHDNESIYNQSYDRTSSSFHETRDVEELSDVECDRDRDQPWVTKCSAYHCSQKIGNPIIV